MLVYFFFLYQIFTATDQSIEVLKSSFSLIIFVHAGKAYHIMLDRLITLIEPVVYCTFYNALWVFLRLLALKRLKALSETFLSLKRFVWC